jgi:hypothetical protein
MIENTRAAEINFTTEEIAELNAAASAIRIQGLRLPENVLAYSDVEAPSKNWRSAPSHLRKRSVKRRFAQGAGIAQWRGEWILSTPDRSLRLVHKSRILTKCLSSEIGRLLSQLQNYLERLS